LLGLSNDVRCASLIFVQGCQSATGSFGSWQTNSVREVGGKIVYFCFDFLHNGQRLPDIVVNVVVSLKRPDLRD
jgi:hypothetical protein